MILWYLVNDVAPESLFVRCGVVRKSVWGYVTVERCLQIPKGIKVPGANMKLLSSPDLSVSHSLLDILSTRQPVPHLSLRTGNLFMRWAVSCRGLVAKYECPRPASVVAPTIGAKAINGDCRVPAAWYSQHHHVGLGDTCTFELPSRCLSIGYSSAYLLSFARFQCHG